MLPHKIFGIYTEAMKMLLGHKLYSWPNTMLLGGQTTVSHVSISAPALTWFRLSDRSRISQAISFAVEACETNRLLGRKASCWKKDSEKFFALFVAISQASTRHLCAWGLVWASAEQQR